MDSIFKNMQKKICTEICKICRGPYFASIFCIKSRWTHVRCRPTVRKRPGGEVTILSCGGDMERC